MLPQQWLVSSVGQSAALRTPVSGVRISHESQKWRLGRLGVCAGLRTWFDSTRLHKQILIYRSDNEEVFFRFNSTVVVQLTCNEQVVGSNPT